MSGPPPSRYGLGGALSRPCRRLLVRATGRCTGPAQPAWTCRVPGRRHHLGPGREPDQGCCRTAYRPRRPTTPPIDHRRRLRGRPPHQDQRRSNSLWTGRPPSATSARRFTCGFLPGSYPRAWPTLDVRARAQSSRAGDEHPVGRTRVGGPAVVGFVGGTGRSVTSDVLVRRGRPVQNACQAPFVLGTITAAGLALCPFLKDLTAIVARTAGLGGVRGPAQSR